MDHTKVPSSEAATQTAPPQHFAATNATHETILQAGLPNEDQKAVNYLKAGNPNPQSAPSSRSGLNLYVVKLTLAAGLGGLLFGYDTGTSESSSYYDRSSKRRLSCTDMPSISVDRSVSTYACYWDLIHLIAASCCPVLWECPILWAMCTAPFCLIIFRWKYGSF